MGLHILWELLIANHLDQSLCLTNQKHGAAVRTYLLHSSGAQLWWTASANWAQMQEQNHFLELNRHILTFLHLILTCMVTYWTAVGILLRERFHAFISPLSNPNRFGLKNGKRVLYVQTSSHYLSTHFDNANLMPGLYESQYQVYT
jgi:hypothetical protein